MSRYTFGGAVITSVVGYAMIWLALDGSNLTAGIIGGALLGGGIATGLLGR